MLEDLPLQALFQFEVQIPYLSKPPLFDGDLGSWPRESFAPDLTLSVWEEQFADVCWGWDEDALYAAFGVYGRTRLPKCDPKRWWKRTGLRLCIDTRDARDLKRATRFCHFFYVLPTGGGAKGRQPLVGMHRMSRAKEPPTEVDVSQIVMAANVTRSEYVIELAIPGSCLHGWDPAEHPRIGIFYKVRDTQWGDQLFSATDEMGWNADPSTWATGVLVR